MYADLVDTGDKSALRRFYCQLSKFCETSVHPLADLGIGSRETYDGVESSSGKEGKGKGITYGPESNSDILVPDRSSPRPSGNIQEAAPDSLGPTIRSVDQHRNHEGHFICCRYLELCVNTTQHRTCLGEIRLNGVGNDPGICVNDDAHLFGKIHETYFNARRSSRFGFLYKPVDIQFIRFSVFGGGHVGIYEKPMALPPEADVIEGKWQYYECPLTPLPPIDSRTFFHYFWNHERHCSAETYLSSSLFLNRLPKKMGASMLEQGGSNTLNLGYGIHIIEGPNKKLLSLAIFIILVLSFAASLAYSLATHAQESGFGIGQWMVAAMTAGLGAIYFDLTE